MVHVISVHVSVAMAPSRARTAAETPGGIVHGILFQSFYCGTIFLPIAVVYVTLEIVKANKHQLRGGRRNKYIQVPSEVSPH